MKTVLVTVWENRYKINGTFNHKTLNADHIRLTPSKHTTSLTSEGEFLYWSLHKLRYKCNIMLGSGRRQAAESVKEETTAGVRQAYGRRTAVRICFQPEDNFWAHTKCSLACRAVRTTRKARCRYNETGLFSASTSTIFSTMTRLIRSVKKKWKLKLQPLKLCKQNVQTWLI